MQTLKLIINGQGHVPSFKNKKRAILDSKTGHHRTLTEPKTKQWMNHCTLNFVSQLLLQCQTIEGGTSTECLQRFLTAYVPHDDCLQVISEIKVVSSYGPEPIAEITITRI